MAECDFTRLMRAQAIPPPDPEMETAAGAAESDEQNTIHSDDDTGAQIVQAHADVDVRLAARQYLAQGWALVPIAKGSKGPNHTGWNLKPQCVTTDHQVGRIEAGIGIAHAFSGTCCIDLDDLAKCRDWLFDEHLVIIDFLLDADDAVQIVSGRANRGKLLYRLPDGIDRLVTVKVKECGLELRCATEEEGKTVQDVLPPSLHPEMKTAYRWGGKGDWHALPALPDELLEVWQMLATKLEPVRASAGVSDGDPDADPVVKHLEQNKWVKARLRDGTRHIRCPFEADHTSANKTGDCSYFPALTGGYAQGHFKCLHAHCADRTDQEFLDRIGYDRHAVIAAQFDLVLGEEESGRAAGPLDEYFAYLPDHKYLHRPTRQFWPAASVDGHRPIRIDRLKPSQWLDQHRGIHQATWHPDFPEVLEDWVVADGGLIEKPGNRAYNLYRAPVVLGGDAAQIAPWLDHLHAIYPGEADHMMKWMAHRIQRPGEKINHALVLGGQQGIGKDSILEPVKRAVGQWNWSEITPGMLLDRFNPFVRSVVLRINEARDLGDVDRFAFYDHSKAYIAAPPDVLTCNDKFTKAFPVFNVMGVIITTNHKVNGIYLPPDDRRHFVAWSETNRSQFDEEYWSRLWAWIEAGGSNNVAEYLRNLDLSTFNPKAPPPKTEAFYAIVQANANPDDVALAALLRDGDGNKLPAVTLDVVRQMCNASNFDDLASVLTDRNARRRIPHMMDRAGYVPVRNPNAPKDGYWKVCGSRVAIYCNEELTMADRLVECHKLERGLR